MDKTRALRLSLIAIVSVVLVESIAGFLVNSLVIMTDAAHATFDAIATLILLLTAQWAVKPADEEHTYGHAKIESIGGLLGGIALIVIAILLIYESSLRLLFGGTRVLLGTIGFISIGYTFCIDVFRVWTLSSATDKEGLTVKANLYHAFSDMVSTIVALVGYYFATVAGISQGDAIGSFALSILLSYLSIGLIRNSSIELSDAISGKTLAEIRKRVVSTPGVLDCKNLRARKMGAQYYVDTTVIVPEHIGIQEAHEIATEIESNVASSLGDTTVTVHVEPSTREAALENEIKSIATSVEGVKGVHDTSIYYARGSLYVTMHAQVDGNLPLEDAHRVAEKIERVLHSRVSNIAKITVHLEPFDHLKISPEHMAEKAEIEKAIRKMIAKYPQVMKMKTATFYESGEQHYINIDLTLDRKHSVEEVHSVVSEIEDALQRRFEKTIVTIHSEPE